MNTPVEVDGNRGVIRWIGNTRFAKSMMYGVEFDEAVGKNYGTVNGKEYFRCAENHGLFVKKRRLTNLDPQRRQKRPGFQFNKAKTNDLFVQGDADDGFMDL